MIEHASETTAEIHYPGEVTLNLGALATPLNRRMTRAGFDFDVVGTVADRDLIFTSRTLTVVVARCPRRPGVIRVRTESPRGDSRLAARDRHVAGSAVVGHFTEGHAADRVAWTHAGRCYETRPSAEGPVRPTRFHRPPAAPLEAETDAALDAVAAEAEATLAPAETAAEMLARERRADPLCHLRDEIARDDAGTQEQSVPHKLAIYTMTTSLMVVSLPVGAGMLTYNLMKGGSLTATARAMALTGIAVGASALAGGQDFAAMAATLF